MRNYTVSEMSRKIGSGKFFLHNDLWREYPTLSQGYSTAFRRGLPGKLLGYRGGGGLGQADIFFEVVVGHKSKTLLNIGHGLEVHLLEDLVPALLLAEEHLFMRAEVSEVELSLWGGGGVCRVHSD